MLETDKVIRYKLILFGDEAVGKTSLVQRYVNDKFDDNYISTLGYNVYEKRVLCGERVVSLMIYDIGGQEKFADIRKMYAQGADTALIVYDVTNKESFDNVKKWKNNLQRIAGDIPFIIIGNKVDLENRQVDSILGENLYMELGAMDFFETSAKTSQNVELVFIRLASETLSYNI